MFLRVFQLASVGEHINFFPNATGLPMYGVIHVHLVLVDLVGKEANLLPLAIFVSFTSSCGAGEVARWLRALPTLLSSILSNRYMVAHNHLK